METVMQGCQIFVGTIYQQWGKDTKLSKYITNGHKIYKMAA
jgi:hypothetical protein